MTFRACRALGAGGLALAVVVGGPAGGFARVAPAQAAERVPARVAAPAAPIAPTAPASAPVATTDSTVEVGEVSRDYLLGGAPAVAGAGAPLLLLFHGIDQAAPDFLSEVNILDAAARAGVVVAAPVSPDDSWNDGRFGPTGADDDGFAMAIIGQLAGSGAIDPARVTVAGFSNGAGMAIELASRHPDAIAALVSVDGETLSGPNQTLPTGPIPAFFIHGTDDPVQPIEGRAYTSDRYPGYLSEADTINGFLAADGVAGTAPVQVQAPRHRGTVGPVTVTRWSQPGAVPVTYASIAGMGHKWPARSCSPLAVSPDVVAKTAQAKRTAAQVSAIRHQIRHQIRRPGAGHALAALLPALLRKSKSQTLALRRATAAATRVTAGRQALITAMLPDAEVAACDTGGGPNTRSADISANSLILGVAGSARLGG